MFLNEKIIYDKKNLIKKIIINGKKNMKIVK